MGSETRVGEYVLDTELGRGALGTVYRGRSADGRVVAIKTFDPALAGDGTFRARVAREARLAREIRDPHLVELVELGEADGTPFLVLEYLPGGSLAERLAEGPLTGDEMTRLVAIAYETGEHLQVVEALRSGDEKRAAAAMADHVLMTRERVFKREVGVSVEGDRGLFRLAPTAGTAEVRQRLSRGGS